MPQPKRKKTNETSRERFQVLNLEEVDLLTQSKDPTIGYFHLFAIFVKEADAKNNVRGASWTLFDERREIEIKLCGSVENYIKPKFGDIIRIHRARVNPIGQIAEIAAPQNVVVWDSFIDDPEPKSTAKEPTITDEDIARCKELQILLTTRIIKIVEMNNSERIGVCFFTIAGRIDASRVDDYGHLIIEFNDGTGQCKLKVFKQLNPKFEDNIHYSIAIQLRVGDYFIANNVKYEKNNPALYLSANTQCGKSFRPVTNKSILGMILGSRLKSDLNEGSQTQQNTAHANNLHPNDPSGSTNQPPGRRRSPRLIDRENQQQQQELVAQQPIATVINQNGAPHNNNFSSGSQSCFSDSSGLEQSQLPIERHDDPIQNPPNSDNHSANALIVRPNTSTTDPTSPCFNNNFNRTPLDCPLTKRTPFDQIIPKPMPYCFYDIVGQVRAAPHVTSKYNNCVLQIYDGSLHKHQNFYALEVERVMPNCVLLYIYSKQKEEDTDEHIEKSKKMVEGDLIYVRNVKASFRDGKLKLELSANKVHGKSINVIDKNSDTGKALLNIVENPLVEGIDEIPYDNESQYAESTHSFTQNIMT